MAVRLTGKPGGTGAMAREYRAKVFMPFANIEAATPC